MSLTNFLSSGFEFTEAENHLQFRFRTLNYFMIIALSFGALIGILGLVKVMYIGEVQPIVNISYAFFNVFLIIILRRSKNIFRKVAWAQVLSSLVVFVIALITVVNDEARIAWFYCAIYLAYLLLGERAGNVLTITSILVIILCQQYFDLNLSNTAIQTTIFSLIVFGLLSRVYNLQVKSYENQLQNINYDLADGIKNIDMALEGALTESKAKSLFLANMSHEIRTPMNGMLSMVQVLRSTKLDEKQSEYLESIERAGSILMKLIDDLLDLSKIESGKFEINKNEFKLWDFMDDILLQTEFLFDEKKVYFNVDIDDDLPAYLITDDTRLKQVVINLINNAAKFTSQGEVNLIITGSKHADNFNLHIEINDTGIGIAADKMESIFEPFHQLSPARIYNRGVGLGLPICKKIISALGGTIKVHSVEGKGSRFYLDLILPVVEDPEVKITKVLTDVLLRPLNILLVEDDKISSLAVETWLVNKGHKVTVTENGVQAVEFLKTEEVDVILMDIHMPEMNGIEATKIIKEEKLSEAPIIGMTASVMNDERNSYAKAGMNELVEKPVNFEHLMSIVKDKLNV